MLGLEAELVRMSYSMRKTEGRISYFSREVAREVTQPLWPSRVPRRTSCSAMVKIDGEGERMVRSLTLGR
jgi:hypothetical protein